MIEIDKQNDIVNKRTNWKIQNKEIIQINGWKFDCYVFKFKITKEEDMQDFSDFVSSDKIINAQDLCFFLKFRDIKFSIRFRPIIKLGLKKNYEYLRSVIAFRRRMLIAQLKEFVKIKRENPAM